MSEVYESLAQEPPADLKQLETGSHDHLEFSGNDGALLVPALNLQPLGAAGVVLQVGINSDSYNCGLGVALQTELQNEASGWYSYNGFGVTKNKATNAVKFHPGMRGAQLRVEGGGGFYNSNVGFTPQNWSDTKKLHTLEITLRTTGENEILLRSCEGEEWRKAWQNKLFDGGRLPAVYAWIDFGGERGKPLLVSRVALRAFSSSAPMAACTLPIELINVGWDSDDGGDSDGWDQFLDGWRDAPY